MFSNVLSHIAGSSQEETDAAWQSCTVHIFKDKYISKFINLTPQIKNLDLMNYLEAEPSRNLTEENFIFSLMKTLGFQTFHYTTDAERRGILMIKF